jgi:hypothetical protein
MSKSKDLERKARLGFEENLQGIGLRPVVQRDYKIGGHSIDYKCKRIDGKTAFVLVVGMGTHGTDSLRKQFGYVDGLLYAKARGFIYEDFDIIIVLDEKPKASTVARELIDQLVWRGATFVYLSDLGE